MVTRRRQKGQLATRSASHDEPKGTFRHNLWWPLAVVGVSALLAFVPTLANDFTNWDDNVNLIDNPFLLPPSWWGFFELWKAPYENLYVPLFYTSYYLDLLLSGGRPKPFVTHLINLFTHAANAVLVAFVVRKLWLASEGQLGERARGTRAWGLALPWTVGALLFAVHPIQTEVVAWATGRKDLLAAFLCLASWVCWLHADVCGPERQKLLRKVAFGLFLAALFAKPASVALPAALLVCDWFLFRPHWIVLARRYALWFAAAALWTVTTKGTQELSQQAREALTPLWTRPFVAADALRFYLGKILWPLNLAPVYAHTPKLASRATEFWLSLPLVLLGLAWLWRRRTVWGLAAALFVVFVAPVLGLVPFAYQRYSTVADRYVYLSMVGVALAAAAALGRGLGRWSAERLAAASALLILGLALLSWRQSRVWRNSVSLWEHNVRLIPHCAVAHANLAATYATADKREDAKRHNERALELDPAQERAHSNLGLLLAWEGETTRAVTHLRRAIELRPNFAAPYAHLGDCYLKLGQLKEAADYYRAALDRDPRNAKAALGLSYCYYRRGRVSEAEITLQEAIAARPNNPVVWVAYGHFYLETGRMAEARAAYERALAVDPHYEEARAALEHMQRVDHQPSHVMSH